MAAVRPVTPAEADGWLRMRMALWPEGSETEHRDEVETFLKGGARARPTAVLIAENESHAAQGFVELAIRPHAEGCVTDRIVYLEGWCVKPEARRQGVGLALIAAAEEWGRAQGCTEFASDALSDNDTGAAAHRAAGFTEVGFVRCFRKDLQGAVRTLRSAASCGACPRHCAITDRFASFLPPGRLPCCRRTNRKLVSLQC